MGMRTDGSYRFYIYDTKHSVKIDPTDIRESIEKSIDGATLKEVKKRQLPPYNTYVGLFGKYMLFRHNGEYVIATAEEVPQEERRQHRKKKDNEQ